MAQAQEQLEHVDAVMIGRAAYDNRGSLSMRIDFSMTIMIYQHVMTLPRRCHLYRRANEEGRTHDVDYSAHLTTVLWSTWGSTLETFPGEASSNRNPDIARRRELLLRPQLVR